MTRSETVSFKISWIALLLSGVATLGYGLIVVVLPSTDTGYFRAIGAASIGMGLFGILITLTAFRQRQRWAYLALWYYPVFWTAHLLGNLPPGKDHIHQVVFIALSLLGLALPAGEFFRVRSPHR
jgi:uncharacterized membrane protein HdeD (DUF308 family)